MIPGQVFGSLSRDQHPQNLSLCHHGSDHSVSPAEQNPWPHTAPDFSPVLRLSIQIQMSSKLQTLARVSAVRNVVLFLPHMLGPIGRLVLNLERGLETSTDWWNSSMDVLISVMLTADLRSVEFSPTGKVQFWSCEGSGPFHVSCCSLIRFMFDSDVCFHGNAATTWEPCSNSPFSAAPPL